MSRYISDRDSYQNQLRIFKTPAALLLAMNASMNFTLLGAVLRSKDYDQDGIPDVYDSIDDGEKQD